MVKHYLKNNFVNEYKDYLNLKGLNPYIDIDTTHDKGNKSEFYNDLVIFLNRQEENFKFEEKWSYKMNGPVKGNIIPSGIEVINKNLYIRSDQLGFSVPQDKLKKGNLWDDRYPYCIILNNDNSSSTHTFIANIINDTRTIGGSFLWSVTKTLNKDSDLVWSSKLNLNKGIKCYIEDAVDLTLYEIKVFYTLYDCCKDYETIKKIMNKSKFILLDDGDAEEIFNWLIHFKNFKTYVDFFCFNDFLDKQLNVIDITTSNVEDNKINCLTEASVFKYLEDFNKKPRISSIEDKEQIKKVLRNVQLLTIKRSEKIESIMNKIKVINFDEFVDEKIKLEMHGVQFINIDTSLPSNEIKTSTNEYLKNIINKDDIVFIVCSSVKKDIVLKTLEIVKKLSFLTIGIGLKGKLLSNLNKYVDTVISIPSDDLKDNTNINLDNPLYYTIKSIIDIIFTKGNIINIDLDDIKTLLKNGRNSLVTTSCASGDNRAIDSTLQAYNNLTNKDFSDIIINIVSDYTLTNFEIKDIVETIKKSVNNENINILFQVILNNKINKNKEIIVTLIALY